MKLMNEVIIMFQLIYELCDTLEDQGVDVVDFRNSASTIAKRIKKNATVRTGKSQMSINKRGAV